jgi:hypothetical protein
MSFKNKRQSQIVGISQYAYFSHMCMQCTLYCAMHMEGEKETLFSRVGQRPYAMLKAPVPSITVVKQH